jgi:hypothetical protein
MPCFLQPKLTKKRLRGEEYRVHDSRLEEPSIVELEHPPQHPELLLPPFANTVQI